MQISEKLEILLYQILKINKNLKNQLDNFNIDYNLKIDCENLKYVFIIIELLIMFEKLKLGTT